jgi:hypothetical protein
MPRKGFRDGVFQNETPCNPHKPQCIRALLVLLLRQAVDTADECLGRNASRIAAPVPVVDSWGSGAGCAFIDPPQNLRSDMLPDAEKVWGHTPGVETPFTPDEPGGLDGGDGVEGSLH